MKITIVSLMWLVGFVFGDLLATTIGYQYSQLERETSSSTSIELGGSNESVFVSESVSFPVKYIVNGTRVSFEDRIIPDGRLVEKFDSKAKNSSEVKFVGFLKDYMEQLASCVDYAKRDDLFFSFFSKKRVNLYTLSCLRKIASELKAMKYIASDEMSNNGFLERRDLINELNSRLERIEISKRDIWSEKMSIDAMNHLELCTCSNVFFFITSFLEWSWVKGYLLKESYEMSKVYFLLSSFFSMGYFVYWGVYTFLSKKNKDAKGIRVAILNLINGLVYYPIDLLLYLSKFGFLVNASHDLCNPTGMLAIFFRYFACQHITSLMCAPEHRSFLKLLEGEKEMVGYLSESNKRVRLLYTALKGAGVDIPISLCGIINSFVDINSFIEGTYPERVDSLKKHYYNKVASLPIFSYNYLLRHVGLNIYKAVNVGLVSGIMIEGVIYFVASVLSVKGAISRL